MTTQEKLQAKAESLRAKIAKGEANVEALRVQLAKIEARLTGAPQPITGLDMLWREALPIARTRSSKIQCRTEWNRIPVEDRPQLKEVIAALRIWNRCPEWKKDGNAYVPGLHRWIKFRQWEDLPQVSKRDPLARPQPTQKPIQKPAPDEVATAEDIASILNLKSKPKSASK